MEKKAAKIIFLLTVIIIVALIGFLFKTGQTKKPEPAQFDWELLSKISIRDGSGEVILEKNGESWTVASEEGLKADMSLVDNLIESLKSLEGKELVSQNKEKWSLFQVEKEYPLLTLTFGQSSVTSFIVGKMSSSGNGTYIRFVPGNDVYLVSGYFGSLFSSESWANLRLFETYPSDITSFTIKNKKGGTAKFDRGEDGKWKKGEQEIDKDSVERFLDQLTSLEATKAAKLVKNIAPADMTITIKDNEGAEISVAFARENKEFFALNESAGISYQLSDDEYETIMTSSLQLQGSL